MYSTLTRIESKEGIIAAIKNGRISHRSLDLKELESQLQKLYTQIEVLARKDIDQIIQENEIE